MKVVKKIFCWVIGILNVLVVCGLIICAYSIYLRPADYPNWSYLGMMLPFFVIAALVFLLIWPFLKWKYCAISLLGIIICWGSIRDYCPINLFKDVPEGKTINLLSYNVGIFRNYNYQSGKTDIADYIINSNADVVCLQDVWRIRNKQPYASFNAVFPYIHKGEEASYDCVLLSKFPILSSQQIDLGSKAAKCMSYDLLIYDDTVKVINCHLESYLLNDDDKQLYKQMVKRSVHMKDDQEQDSINMKQSFWWLEGKLTKANAARSLQAELLKTMIDSLPNKYIIVCGDFNDSPVSYVHKTLTEKLKDAYTESGNGPGWSYNQNGMYFRIDHILMSESFSSYKAKVDKYGQESDHYPIFCTLEMR